MRTRPAAILWFQGAFVAQWLMTTGTTIFTAFFRAGPLRSAAVSQSYSYMLFAPVVAGLAMKTAYSGLILFLVVRQRSTGRIFIAVLLALTAVGLIFLGVTRQLAATPPALINYAAHVILAVCLWLLFRPDAKKWFADEWTGPHVTKVFE